MRNLSLLNLLASNAKAGSFRAEAATNTIYLYDVIVGSDLEAEFFGGVSAGQFIDALKGMSGPVSLRVNSPGGDVFAARAMAQAMREYPGEITATVDGVAASAASIIAVSASSCAMAPGSMLMIHDAWTICCGDGEDMLAQAALLEKIDGTIAATYAAKGKGDAAHYASLMDAETWFTPEEALAEGLCDTVIEETPSAKPKAWNLAAFANAPQAAAPEPLATPEPAPEPVIDNSEIDRQRRINALRLRMIEQAA
jgi:ATP-dependent Clp protease protease subunit